MDQKDHLLNFQSATIYLESSENYTMDKFDNNIHISISKVNEL